VRLLIADFAGDGEKFARRLLAKNPNLRIICSSHHDCQMPVSWLAPERQAGLTKPYALSELLKAARRVLDA
jgi:hypothetical protein